MESYWREASSFNKGFLYSPALLELAAALQPHPPKFWNYRHASLCLAKEDFFREMQRGIQKANG